MERLTPIIEKVALEVLDDGKEHELKEIRDIINRNCGANEAQINSVFYRLRKAQKVILIRRGLYIRGNGPDKMYEITGTNLCDKIQDIFDSMNMQAKSLWLNIDDIINLSEEELRKIRVLKSIYDIIEAERDLITNREKEIDENGNKNQ